MARGVMGKAPGKRDKENASRDAEGPRRRLVPRVGGRAGIGAGSEEPRGERCDGAGAGGALPAPEAGRGAEGERVFPMEPCGGAARAAGMR